MKNMQNLFIIHMINKFIAIAPPITLLVIRICLHKNQWGSLAVNDDC